jgi:hypothetical protein
METLVLKTEWIIYCDNCGHPAHCGEKLRKDVQNTPASMNAYYRDEEKGYWSRSVTDTEMTNL